MKYVSEGTQCQYWLVQMSSTDQEYINMANAE